MAKPTKPARAASLGLCAEQLPLASLTTGVKFLVAILRPLPSLTLIARAQRLPLTAVSKKARAASLATGVKLLPPTFLTVGELGLYLSNHEPTLAQARADHALDVPPGF
jgi:hypothetical protein